MTTFDFSSMLDALVPQTSKVIPEMEFQHDPLSSFSFYTSHDNVEHELITGKQQATGETIVKVRYHGKPQVLLQKYNGEYHLYIYMGKIDDEVSYREIVGTIGPRSADFQPYVAGRGRRGSSSTADVAMASALCPFKARVAKPKTPRARKVVRPPPSGVGETFRHLATRFRASQAPILRNFRSVARAQLGTGQLLADDGSDLSDMFSRALGSTPPQPERMETSPFVGSRRGQCSLTPMEFGKCKKISSDIKYLRSL